MSQISLPFDWSAHAGDGGFLLSDANAQAARFIEQWRDWPIPIGILLGPRRSGRSTLAHLFARASDGTVMDDAEGAEETALFHAWNMARDGGKPLLIVAERDPALWTISLPDLRSRLSAAPVATIRPPDDALIRALLERDIQALGIEYAPDAIPFIQARIERSYAAVGQVLDTLNRISLERRRKITVTLAKEALHMAGLLDI